MISERSIQDSNIIDVKPASINKNKYLNKYYGGDTVHSLRGGARREGIEKLERKNKNSKKESKKDQIFNRLYSTGLKSGYQKIERKSR